MQDSTGCKTALDARQHWMQGSTGCKVALDASRCNERHVGVLRALADTIMKNIAKGVLYQLICRMATTSHLIEPVLTYILI